ncbi:MAG: hypothetical protein U0T33_08490 [Bacteroidales bacterium]
MSFRINTGRRIIRPFIFLVLSCYFSISYSQGPVIQDSTKIVKGSYIMMNEIKYFISHDTIIRIPDNLIRKKISGDRRTETFYDSLKTRASHSHFTKALVDLVIVRPDTLSRTRIVDKSDDRFRSFNGIRIRKISVQRLDVFGTSLDNPGYNNPNGIEKYLNGSHINTRENIIRKNLLFSEGDSITPLKMADNERILRQLQYIDDARILIVPVSSEEADIVVITKDTYSIGGNYTFRSPTKGSFWLYDKNIFGSGHELKIEVPYSTNTSDSPGIGLSYYLNNIKKSFVNLTFAYYNGLGRRSYSVAASRDLVSSETKYAGGITIRQMFTSEDLDTLPVPHPLYYNYQDYWIERAFLVDRASVSRVITGVRYIDDNIYERPEISPDSYYTLQKKAILLGSISYSRQKFYKTSMIYGYGRTEDMPYGGLVRFTAGMERNEFKNRAYMAADLSSGWSIPSLGYFQFSAGVGSFLRSGEPEQAVINSRLMFVSNLSILGASRLRNFITIGFTGGFVRYYDEYLSVARDNGFTGFRNDSLRARQRLRISLESVLFTPVNYLGFRIAVFGFADLAALAGTKREIDDGSFLSGIGFGVRIRNNNFVFNTFQVRIGFFPDAPDYSRLSHVNASSEQMLRPNTFDPGPPAMIPYR